MTFEFTLTTFWITLILIACLMGAVQGTCAYLILAERKISAWAQDRVGPNRVGREVGLPFGLLQPIADGLKFLLKEQVVPAHVDKLFYFAGPMIAVSTALLAIAVVPFGRTTPAPSFPWPATAREKAELLAAHPGLEQQIAEYNDTVQFVIAPHVDIGVVFVFAVGSLAAYAIVLGGWSSNNKYSFLGGLGRRPSSSATRSRWACRCWASSSCAGRSTSSGSLIIKSITAGTSSSSRWRAC